MSEETMRAKLFGAKGRRIFYIKMTLTVPNKLISTVNDVTPADEVRLGRLFVCAAFLAKEAGIALSGYRLIVNCKDHGGQEVYHIHRHLLGGRRLGRLAKTRVRLVR